MTSNNQTKHQGGNASTTWGCVPKTENNNYQQRNSTTPPQTQTKLKWQQ